MFHIVARPQFAIEIVTVMTDVSPVGTSNIYNNYVRAKLPPGSTTGAVPKTHRAGGVAGALGMGQQKSFAIRTFNSFWGYTMPFVGAIVADCWFGRYNSTLVFSLIYLYVKTTRLPKSMDVDSCPLPS